MANARSLSVMTNETHSNRSEKGSPMHKLQDKICVPIFLQLRRDVGCKRRRFLAIVSELFKNRLQRQRIYNPGLNFQAVSYQENSTL